METDSLGALDSKTMPVADLLRRIAIELRSLTRTVDDLQIVVGKLVANSAACDVHVVRQLQNFDSLGQTVSGVADFIDALGATAPEHWRLNPHPASRVLLLSDLALRLVSHHDRALAVETSEAGEFEFF